MQIRPSNAGRWVNCPASPRLEAQYPDVESEDAREGTAAHWVAAQVLGGHASLDELTDRKAPNGVIVTGEMVEHTQLYIETVQTVTATPVVERTIPTVPGVDDGTPDALYIDGDRGYLWDYKYGYGIVDAPGNWQLATYAVAMFIRHEWNLAHVTATIVQPRPFHPDGRVRSWTVDRDAAWSLLTRLQNAAHAASDPTSPAATGPHCKYCRALHGCEAARRAALNGVDISLRASVDAPPSASLGSELTTLRRASEAIKLRLDAIEGHALDVIAKGGIVPGWSVERAYGRRKWKDESQVAVLEVLTGLTLTEQRPLTPAAAEKAGADKVLVKQFTTTPETGRKLVERDSSAKAREVFK